MDWLQRPVNTEGIPGFDLADQISGDQIRRRRAFRLGSTCACCLTVARGGSGKYLLDAGQLGGGIA